MITRSVSNTGAARTDRPRGAALWALVVLGGGWIGVRLMIGGMAFPSAQGEENSSPDGIPFVSADPSKSIDAIATLPTTPSVPSLGPLALNSPARTIDGAEKPLFRSNPGTILGVHQFTQAPVLVMEASAPTDDIERAYAGQIGPFFLFAGTDGRDDVPPNWASDVPDVQAPPHRPFSLYAYLFYRPHGGEAAPFALYGGSQLFARADWRPLGGPLGKRASLYVRASRDLTSDGPLETALGVSMAPMGDIPLIVHTERRFRPHQPDATVAFVSTGGAAQDLPTNARLDWDGQAGYVVPDKGESTPFFDGQARLTAPVATASDWSLRGGAMAATGGQKGAARLDIGPVLTVQNGAMQGQFGWRFRVAGEAQPKSGPAVTLSIGF